MLENAVVNVREMPGLARHQLCEMIQKVHRSGWISFEAFEITKNDISKFDFINVNTCIILRKQCQKYKDDLKKCVALVKMLVLKRWGWVYIPGVSRPLRKDEDWDFDPEAYRLYHSFETKWPCLSFDVITDDLGDNRTDFPMSCYLIGGTQAEKATNNELIVMKLSDLYPIESDGVSDNEEDFEENARNKEPKFHAATIPHIGIINRVKMTTLGQSKVCAAFNSQGKVTLWNLTQAMEEIAGIEGRDRIVKRPKERPLFSFVGHQAEGYALSWSPLKMGDVYAHQLVEDPRRLASGDIRHKIHLWTMAEGGQWVIDEKPLSNTRTLWKIFAGHLRKKRCLLHVLPTVASSCGILGQQISRKSAPSVACVCTVENAHDSHANVIAWNKFEPLLVSGGDDTFLNIWSLKTMKYKEPVAQFKQHKAPITSVEWSPHESTTMMASGEDNQITIWDLSSKLIRRKILQEYLNSCCLFTWDKRKCIGIVRFRVLRLPRHYLDSTCSNQ
ncbi:Glutamate-rich WD repeat containing 1 [Dirofilaria immitis]|nr:Glutamate-rich WD repeat containing 1 [Dirofilaria immitis]